MRQKDHWKYETINWETFTIIINPCWHSFWEGVQLWPRLGVLSVFGFWDSRVLPFIIAWVPFLFRNLKPIGRQEWSLLLVVWGSCRTTTIRGRSWKIFGCHVGSSVEDYRRKVKAAANLYTQGDKIAMWLPKRSWSESWLQMWWCMDMYGITLIYKCIVSWFANGVSIQFQWFFFSTIVFDTVLFRQLVTILRICDIRVHIAFSSFNLTLFLANVHQGNWWTNVSVVSGLHATLNHSQQLWGDVSCSVMSQDVEFKNALQAVQKQPLGFHLVVSYSAILSRYGKLCSEKKFKGETIIGP